MNIKGRKLYKVGTRYAFSAALVISAALVPFSAQADTITSVRASGLTFSSGECSITGASGSCTTSVSPIGGFPGGNALSAYTTTNIVPDVNSNTGIIVSGPASGSLAPGDLIPVAWDFILNGKGGSADWSITFNLVSSGGANSQFFSSGTAAYGSEVTGSGNIFEIANDSLSSYNFTLYMHATDSNYTLTIPAGRTIDLDPVATPEPASALLFACGIGLVMVVGQKRRRLTRS